MLKRILFYLLLSFSFPVILNAQTSIEVDGLDSASLHLNTDEIIDATVIELNNGVPNSFFSNFHFRNQGDQLHIDSYSDLPNAGLDRLKMTVDGTVSLESLSGTGNRNLIATSDGTIQAVPNVSVVKSVFLSPNDWYYNDGFASVNVYQVFSNIVDNAYNRADFTANMKRPGDFSGVGTVEIQLLYTTNTIGSGDLDFQLNYNSVSVGQNIQAAVPAGQVVNISQGFSPTENNLLKSISFLIPATALSELLWGFDFSVNTTEGDIRFYGMEIIYP